jgi:hypothetical protein
MKNPNAWSCLVCAFADALKSDFDEIIKAIGHDGSEKIWPQLRDPLCRRSFHIGELIEVCLNAGVAVTMLDFELISSNGIDDYTIPFYARTTNFMVGNAGVITGSLNGVRHAVAWDGKIIIDSATGTSYEPYGDFKPETFWRLNKIGEA